jgi:hypothetical protein
VCPAGGVPSTGPAAEATQWLVPPPALSQSRRGLWVSVCPDRASWTLGTILYCGGPQGSTLPCHFIH